MAVMETVVREAELSLVVDSATMIANDVVELRLVSPDGAPLPAWTPGAHVDLVLGDDLVRQYSLCGSPADSGEYRLAVALEPESRGGSRYVHEHLSAGTPVTVRGPRNHFGLVASPAYEFLAGGIGITPLLPMIAEAEASGAQWRLVYVGRVRARMAYLDALAHYGDKVTIVCREDGPRADLDALYGTPRPDTEIYCCGPEPLLAGLEAATAAWRPDAVHVERFTAAEVDTTGDQTFTVVFSRSGIEAEVPPGESIFTVARAHDVSVLGSCLEGVCGTCECDIVSGEVDHRDTVLSDAEKEANESLMICVSRSRGPRLVLDL